VNNKLSRIAIALIAPLLLFGCVLTPGKFVSSMSINADRTFSFTYKGEVIALDLGKAFGKGMSSGSPSEDEAGPAVDTAVAADAAKPAPLVEEKSSPDMIDASTNDQASDDLKNRAIAEALSKEYGYRSVKYLGKGKFDIDYAVSGKLTHNFVFPFNVDAEAVLPFVVIELRQNNIVRVKAPGFANDSSKGKNPMGSGMGSDTSSALDGLFTLDTDAEIVSQNNEDGATKADRRRIIRWRATPLSKDMPTAVLRMGA
jgi:hypothetical protein